MHWPVRHISPIGWLSFSLLLTACSQAPQPAPLVAESKPVSRPAAEAFVHPVPGARLSAGFANYIVKSRGRKHHGADFAAPQGTPVYATRSGVVLSADNTSLSADFGFAVLIEHGDSFQSLSAHLSKVDVQMGQWVMIGQQIGRVGRTGRATGAHLHFELWRNNMPVDPLQVLPKGNQLGQVAQSHTSQPKPKGA